MLAAKLVAKANAFKYTRQIVPKALRLLSSKSFRKIDCTGQHLNINSNSLFNLADEIIFNTITNEENPAKLLQEALEKLSPDSSDGPMLLILAGIHLLRTGQTTIHQYTLPALLKNLNEYYLANKLDEREVYFFASLYAASKDNNSTSAALSESILSNNSNSINNNSADVLALRIAQEQYFKAIGNKNSNNSRYHVLGCALRHRDLLTSVRPSFLPSIYSSMAFGYLENQQLHAAEEITQKALFATNSRDILAVQVLLQCNYLTGRSSEILADIDRYKITSNNVNILPYGEHHWLLQQGSSHVLRGGCYAAFRLIMDNLEKIHENMIQHHEYVHINILVDLSMLLWQVILNLGHDHLLPLDNVTNLLNKIVSLYPSSVADESISSSPSHPLAHIQESLELIQVIALSTKLMAYESHNTNIRYELKQQEKRKVNPLSKLPKPKNLWNMFTSGSSEGDVVSNDDISHPMALKQSAVTSETAQSFTDSENQQIHQLRHEIQQYINKINNTQSPTHEVSFDEQFTQIASLQPKLTPLLLDGSSGSSSNNRDVLLAILYFSLGEFNKCTSLLTNPYYSRYAHLSLSATHRDILIQTFIESLIRAQDYTTAKYFLVERSNLNANDGQTWRRLSIVHSALGEMTNSEAATYTAWQLGIGQGGFGGAM